MKVLIKCLLITLSFILLSSSFIVKQQVISAASLNEIYYLKGAAYNSTLSKIGSSNTDIGSSAVVVTASTAYDGRSVGKERIRAWTRNAIIANYYNAGIVKTNYLSLSFGSPDYVILLVNENEILPQKTESFDEIPGLSYYLKGVLTPIYELSLALIPSINGTVNHNISANQTGISLSITSTSSQWELPSNIGYRDAESYYNGIYNTSTGTTSKQGTSRGASAYVGYKYILQPGQSGNLSASAIAQYEVRVFNDPVSGIPLIFNATSGKANVTHTITGS
ncbi:hypothetical protein J2Z22_002163 [Paenibacillus forsythiae]|uniref:Uncharacterized protein n=1 Tax=Paenibacillus forsythiae TaxID=365616 RepID=A0ABU3H740_9BACL|nr:hypothetical protein [Paenibacillus forsythiae]MDT3426637.1 hypothetical protein [Paenibacillus forsythiae]